MLFNSFHFAVFFPVVLVLVVMLRRNVVARNTVLLIASYYFYGMWDWRFLGLLIISTVIDYGVGLCLGELPTGNLATPQRLRNRKRILIVSLAANLLFLGFFKYFGFFVDNAARLIEAIGFEASIPVLHIVLPVGLSFYTFQSMAYTILVYRGELPPERSLLNFAVYVAFFPQLVAGPIERPTNILPQVQKETSVRLEDLYYGFYLICWGLFKKVVIADNAAPVADMVFDAQNPGGITVLIGVYAFAVQIYCDFSGYTDVARGSARMMGFGLMENFNHPYFAANPGDFWRRWHISLSTWLRDYLYIPLGGNRLGNGRTYLNLMTTMVLGGLWHGAAWNFVFWGVYHGGLLCLHRVLEPFIRKMFHPQTLFGSNLWWIVRVFCYFQLTCIGWLFFRANSAHQVGAMLSALVARPHLNQDILNETALITFAMTAFTLLVVECIQFFTGDDAFVFRLSKPVRGVIYALAFLSFIFFGNFRGVQFIYFQF